MTDQIKETFAIEYRKLTNVSTEYESLPQGRSLVAVIGINEYAHWQKLKNVVQDAIGLRPGKPTQPEYSHPRYWAAFVVVGAEV